MKKVVSIVRHYINKLIILYYKHAPYEYGLNSTDQSRLKITVSMTSYPKRFSMVPLVLKTILRQSMKPDRICLFLCREECPQGIPPEIKNLQEYGLEIIWVKERLRAHTKYYFAMQRFPDDIIITVDDDVLYPHRLIEKLYAAHTRYPQCVCAARVHHLTKKANGELAPYNSWGYEYKKEHLPSDALIATGVGGVLYPPHILPTMAFKQEMIASMCLNADDIWLKWMEFLKGVKVVYVPDANRRIWYAGVEAYKGLVQQNVWESMNDQYIQNLVSSFGFPLT